MTVKMHVWALRLEIKCLIWCLIWSLDNVAPFSMNSICLIPVNFTSALGVNEEHLGMRHYWFGYKFLPLTLQTNHQMTFFLLFLCPITIYWFVGMFQRKNLIPSIFRIGTAPDRQTPSIQTYPFLTSFNFLLARFQLPVRNTHHPCKERGGRGDYVHPKLWLHLGRRQQWLAGETQPDLTIQSWPMWV